jgi:hypothetical protein
VTRELDKLRKRKKTVTWPLRLDPIMRDTINLLAEYEEVNAADLVRHAITMLPKYEYYRREAVRRAK